MRRPKSLRPKVGVQPYYFLLALAEIIIAAGLALLLNWLLEDVLDEQPAFTVGDLQVNGRDLISLGAKPGPAMGDILKTLLAEVQDEILPNTREAQLARANELL